MRTKQSIQNNLNYIFTFPSFKKRLEHHYEKFFFQPTEKFYELCENNPNEAIQELIKHCELALPISIEITHEYLQIPEEYRQAIGFDLGLPGQMYSITKYQFRVFLNNSYGKYIKAAALAHEIAHVYIRNNEINYVTQRNCKGKFSEQMTDLTTVALGLGKLMLEAYDFIHESLFWDNNLKIGYLTPKHICYAQSLMINKLESLNVSSRQSNRL
ncbi:MAG: hypothetical protein KKC11_08505 [Candidatus Omnitrophica bacterium]|nr:hypothetical protein [Candidatus Omnitrophota bacterium]MBU1366341.1 hypothetical protein [Candidatus Omnitrophota bacterium]MBU1809626.1 hypothetical protein [Candidatus Omnitrophota bacterium]